MRVQKVKTRGYLFTFDDLIEEYKCETSIYAINSNKYIFICDTYLGPRIMEKIAEYLKEACGEKPVVVFNSHSDWDHVWGNCYFQNELIISHRLCRERIERTGAESLEILLSRYQRGAVRLVSPNLIFEHEICFPDEGVRFFYTPGHTVDSASCFDEFDVVVYAGDNIESPNPYIQWDNLKEYKTTLENYMEMGCEVFISAHSGLVDKDIINENIKYIKSRM